MANRCRYWIGLMLLLALCYRPAQADGIVPGHVLARLEADDDVEGVEADYHTEAEDQVEGKSLYALRTPEGLDEETFARQLSADPRVRYAEPDTYVDLPEVHGKQFHFAFDFSLNARAYINQLAYRQIHLGRALSLTTGTGVTVAVLDTGVAANHPALKNHLLSGYNVLKPDSAPDDLPDTAQHPAVGHGTMVAGILTRVAPGARILPVRVLNSDGVGTLLGVLQGLRYAIKSGAKVINMSFGSVEASEALSEALDEVQDARVVLVASAGNEGANQVNYPAACEGVIAVTSVESDNSKSPYANYGARISVVAPGSGIRSAYWTGGYASWSGTSFATPFVAAEAALLFSRSASLRAGQVTGLIRSTAHRIDKQNPAFYRRLGHGIIDIEAAVKSVR